MKNIVRAVFSLFMVLALTGCGEPDRSRPSIVTTILSDQLFDGDIQKDPVTGAFTRNTGKLPRVCLPVSIQSAGGILVVYHLSSDRCQRCPGKRNH